MNARVIIIGAGFAGLFAARTLAKRRNIEIILIDRNNSHTFTPLLYQVATCALDPSSIAYPVRSIFRDKPNVRFLMGELISIRPEMQTVDVRTNGTIRQENYDYLIIAAGSVTNYFGNNALANHTFELKSLDDAVELRQHILRLFEKAAWTDDDGYKSALMTMIVVGGGATGLEMSGALYELYNHVLKKEYANRQDLNTRVILIEATDKLLTGYPERLQNAAKEQLESIGVEVWTNSRVDNVTPSSSHALGWSHDSDLYSGLVRRKSLASRKYVSR